MWRAVKFIVIAAVLLVLAWWIGGLPGNVTATSGPYRVETSVPAALLILFVIALLFTILLRLLGGIRRAPGGVVAWRGGRRQRLGELATQRGLVALAAGDIVSARSEAGRARKLLGDTPLALLLTAETARLAAWRSRRSRLSACWPRTRKWASLAIAACCATAWLFRTMRRRATMW